MLLLSGDLDADEPRQPNDLDFDPRGQGSTFQSQHATCEAIRHFSCEGNLYSTVFFEAFFLATGLFSNLSNNGSVILRQSGIGHSTQLEEMIFQILLKTIIGRIPSSDAPRFSNLCVSLAFLWVSDLLVSPPPIQEMRLLQDDSIISKAYLSYLLPANVMKCFASSGLCVIVVWVPRLQCSHQRQLQLTLFVSACVQRSRFKIDTFMD